MQTISDALRDILKSRLQAGPSGFGARMEYDQITPGIPTDTTDYALTFLAQRTTGVSTDYGPGTEPTGYTYLETAFFNSDVPLDAAWHEVDELGVDPLTVSWPDPTSAYNGSSGPRAFIVQFAGVTGNPESVVKQDYGSSSASKTSPAVTASGSGYVVAGYSSAWGEGPVDFDFASADSTILDQGRGPSGSPSSCLAYRYVESAGDYTITVTQVAAETWSCIAMFIPATFEEVVQHATNYSLGTALTTTWPEQPIRHPGAGPVGDPTVNTRDLGLLKRVSLDKSLQMPADQAEVELANHGLDLGWGTDSVFTTNARIRIYQGYGDPDDYIRSFTGIIDRVQDHRDIKTTTISCRSMMALLLDQNFSSNAPQTQDEYQATIDSYNHGGAAPTPLDRTTDNGVYLNMEASDVVSDILDRAGWPDADRDITPTSYVLDEYILQDGWSWAESIIGDERITGYTGYALWDDELGVIHFAPLPATSFSDPATASYTFRTGEDITALDDETDQYDLITRVKARGPLTNTTLKNTWTEVWRTSKLKKPVGIWYDPGEPTVIRVIDRGTKKMYRIRQSDRKILGSFSIADICPHPLGLSGDPSDDTIYWLLEAPWIDGGSGGNKIVKVRRSDSHAIARYAIPDGRWSALKVSSGAIWLTNLDTDKLYQRSKTDASAINSWHHSYSGTTQTNPSGVMVDGTDLFIFYANGGTTARFLQVSTSSPGHVVDIVKTAGTNLHGGEMDTTTHIDCYGDSDSLGLVAKFTLKEAVDHTREIFAEAIDVDLEDELGLLAQSQAREHDAHPDDADHPFEIRRLTLNLDAITNLAQATETAERMLDERGHRRRIVDVGIIGNPALQKTDLIAQVDPAVGLSESALIDTYRSDMVAGGTYLGTLAVIPAQAFDDTPDEEDPAEDDDDIDEVTDPDETDPTPDPDIPAFYIAPDGDDSTGDGSIGNPWATIGKFATVAGAGDTLLCRGGSYTGVSRTIIGTGTGTPSGTSLLPITVAAYPAETPVFHGPGSGSYEQFLMFTDGVAYWDIDGLGVEDFKVGHAGAIYVGRNAGLMVPTHHINVRNCTMTTFPEDAGPFNQLVYLSAYAEDCIVENNVFVGAGSNDGCGVNIGDHEPSPLRSTVQHNVFVNFGDAGAIWYNGDQNTGELLHNTFIDCIRDISLRYYDTVTVRDNASTAASGISNVNDAGTGVATMDHNFGSQTFDVDYTLLGGNTGINAASDGTDAGAIDS